jgi:AhpD family alkylhydroperoxidase
LVTDQRVTEEGCHIPEGFLVNSPEARRGRATNITGVASMTTRITDMNEMRGLYQQMMQMETYGRSTNIEPSLRHLVKIRVSQINGCAYCMSMHTEEALNDGERIDRLAVLSGWRETDWFSSREEAALLWAEKLTSIASDHVSDDDYALVREQFSEKDLSDLTLLVITINGWNRIAIPFQAEPNRFASPVAEDIAAD